MMLTSYKLLGGHHPETATVKNVLLGNLCKRIGAKAVFQETGGAAAAEKNLKDALAQGTPTIAWVDQAHLPYCRRCFSSFMLGKKKLCPRCE